MTLPITATNYNGVVDALRGRQKELGLSNKDLESMADLAAGHVDKILGPSRTKGIGASVLDVLMLVLAVDFVITSSPAKLAQMQASWEQEYGERIESHVRTDHRVSKAAVSRVMQGMSKRALEIKVASGRLASISRKGGKARQKALTPAQRSQLGRKGARARWRKRKPRSNDHESNPNGKSRLFQPLPDGGGRQRDGRIFDR